MEANTEIVDYKKRMDNFPCAFNLAGTDKLTTARLKAVQRNLDSELDANDGCENELIIKRNLLTWVQFRLEKWDEALQLNKQVIESTKSRNIASLANRSFIVWLMKDDVQALKFLEDLEKMKKSDSDFQTFFTDAQAEQAYYYSRLGGLNLQRAINLFCALPQTPVNYLRKFGLGQAYRRMTHINIVFSSSELLTVTDYQKMAAECLFDVAENADGRLSSQAYAQLVILRRSYPFKLIPEDEKMFHGLGVEELCCRALTHGLNIPSVLVQCGRSLKGFNIDTSIELLNKSIAIKEGSAAHHHLGICYRLIAEKPLKRHRSRSEGLSRQTNVGHQKVERHIPGQSKDVSSTSQNEHPGPDKSTVNQQIKHDPADVLDLELTEIDTGSMNAGRSRYSDSNSGLTRGSTLSTGYKHRSARTTGLAQGDSQTNDWKTKTSLKHVVKKYRNVLHLSKDDVNVQKAMKCFEKAIELANENLPAVLDLAMLLKDTNQINEALKQFNSITKDSNLSITHKMTVTTAYEHAGLCYLQLYNATEKNEYLEMGKNKLTKAVIIAADVSHTMPELQGSHREIWQAFTTLLAVNDEEQKPYSHRLKRKIQVLELAREYGDVIDVIQKLKDTGHKELTNPDIVKAALNSYLQLQQTDNALVYHNIVAMNPLVKDSDWWNDGPILSLRVKVLLHAIAGRLKNTDDNPAGLFQQLFDLIFGLCVGLRDPENDKQTDSDSGVLGDVLFIFESGEYPDEENCNPTVKTARCMKRLTSCLFGLATAENLKGTGQYGGDQATIQLDEMLKYQIVIIVLGNETRDRYFNAMLERVSCNLKKAPPRQKILVINTGSEDDKIPGCLRQYKSFKLMDIGILCDPQRIPENLYDTDTTPYTDIIRDVFDGDVDAILKLFCFMIEQTWPCP